ncbi:MAG: hypothetical protein ACUVQQ_14840 [Thermogutta sp.]
MVKLVGSFALILGAVGLAYLAAGQGSAGSTCPASGCVEKTAAVETASYEGCCAGKGAVEAKVVSASSGSGCCASAEACCADGQACCAEGKACCADKSCCDGAACPVSDTACPKEGCGGKGEDKQADTPDEAVPAQPVSYAAPDQTKDGKAKKHEITCPVMGGKVNPENSVEYKGGKISFCCADCIGEFKEHTAKYAAKANAQLVSTKQYVQKACPLSGHAVAEGKQAKVAGIAVGVCGDGCKGKIEGEENADARLALVFSDAAFEKGFAKPAKPAEKRIGDAN